MTRVSSHARLFWLWFVVTFILKRAGGASWSQTDIFYVKVNLAKGPFSLPDAIYLLCCCFSSEKEKKTCCGHHVCTFWEESPEGEMRATRGSDPTLQLECRLSIFFLFFCLWLHTQWRKSINHKRHLHFQLPEHSFIFQQTFQPSKLFAWGWDEGMGRRRRGVEGRKTRSRLQPWITACLCFWQREASRHKERFVAAVKIRDAQRLENMSDVKERVDWGCGLRFQEKEVEDTSARHFW